MMSPTLDGMRSAAEAVHKATTAFRIDRIETHAALVSALEEYGEYADYLNDRISSAHRYLTKGSQADALHELELEPNIFDAAEELDSVDVLLDDWSETFDELFITCPPRLKSAILGELGSAYDTAEQLEQLIRTHRRLAIGRCSLEKRVGVLRQLIEIAPDHPGWTADLQKYESACIKQLVDELDDLQRTTDSELSNSHVVRSKQVTELLRGSDWSSPPSVESIDRGRAVTGELRARLAVRQADAVATIVVREVKAGRDDRAVKHRETLDSLIAIVEKQGLPQPRSIARALEAFSDIDDRQFQNERDIAFREAMRRLEALLAQGSGPGQTATQHCDYLRSALEKLYGFASDPPSSFDQGELDAVRVRVEKKLASVGFRRLAQRGALAATLVAIVVAGGFFASYYYQTSTRAEVVREVESIVFQTHLTDGDLVTAASEWARFTDEHSWLLRDPIAKRYERDADELTSEGQSLFTKTLADVVETEERAENEFADLTRSLEDVKDGQEVADVFQAAKILKSSANASYVDARSAGDDVAKILGANEATSLREAISKAEAQLKRGADDLFRKVSTLAGSERESITNEADVIGAGSNEPLKDRLERCDQLLRRVGVLADYSSEGVRELEARLSTLHADLLASQENQKRRDLWTEEARSGVEAFLAALRRDTEGLPDRLQSDVVSVAESSDVIEACRGWTTLYQRWKNAGEKAFTPDVARSLSADIAQQLSDNPAGDRDVQVKMAAIAKMLDDRANKGRTLTLPLAYLKRPALGEVDEVLELQIGSSVFYTTRRQLARGQWFIDEQNYSPFNGVKIGAERDVSSLLKTRADRAVPAETFAKYTAQCREIMSDALSDKQSVDAAVIQLLEMSVSGEYSSVDPILRSRILAQVFVQCADNLEVFKNDEPYKAFRERVLQATGENQQWINPATRAVRAEQLARAVLSDSTAVQAMIMSHREAVVEMESPPEITWPLLFVGWLDVYDEPMLVMVDGDESLKDGELLRVVARDDGWIEETVGRVVGGNAAFTKSRVLVHGQPVFMRNK